MEEFNKGSVGTGLGRFGTPVKSSAITGGSNAEELSHPSPEPRGEGRLPKPGHGSCPGDNWLKRGPLVEECKGSPPEGVEKINTISSQVPTGQTQPEAEGKGAHCLLGAESR